MKTGSTIPLRRLSPKTNSQAAVLAAFLYLPIKLIIGLVSGYSVLFNATLKYLQLEFGTRVRLSWLAFSCALLPLITAHLTLLIAFFTGGLHPCNPYWQLCHSISATGRAYPQFFVFKALMIPAAILMMAYWAVMYVWLDRMCISRARKRAVLVFGLSASVALIAYTVTLGAQGEPYHLVRRIGVVLFFAFSAFLHLLIASWLVTAEQQSGITKHTEKTVASHLLYLSYFLVFIGAGSAISGFVWSGYKNWDNAFEWLFALAMMGQFAVVGRLWHKDDIRLRISANDHD